MRLSFIKRDAQADRLLILLSDKRDPLRRRVTVSLPLDGDPGDDRVREIGRKALQDAIAALSSAD